MKTTLKLAIFTIALGFFAACGDGAATQEQATDSTATQTEVSAPAPETTPAPADTTAKPADSTATK